jgi:hypothetical protein
MAVIRCYPMILQINTVIDITVSILLISHLSREKYIKEILDHDSRKKKVKKYYFSLSYYFYFFTSTFIQSFFSMSKERTSLDGTIVHTLTEIKTHEDIHDLYQTSTNEEPTSNFKNKSEKIRFALLILGIILAMFMMSLNSTVVAPAMSIIATELNAVQSQTWIATAYLVAVNAFQPLSGKVK